MSRVTFAVLFSIGHHLYLETKCVAPHVCLFSALQSLTNVKNLNMDTLEAISRLDHLRVLELGECETLSHNFTDILSNLKRLERLRLEKVVNLDPDYRMFSILKDLRHFTSLELINIEVKIGFDEALAHCRNLEEFLLIPLYKTQVCKSNIILMLSQC